MEQFFLHIIQILTQENGSRQGVLHPKLKVLRGTRIFRLQKE